MPGQWYMPWQQPPPCGDWWQLSQSYYTAYYYAGATPSSMPTSSTMPQSSIPSPAQMPTPESPHEAMPSQQASEQQAEQAPRGRGGRRRGRGRGQWRGRWRGPGYLQQWYSPWYCPSCYKSSDVIEASSEPITITVKKAKKGKICNIYIY